MRSIKYRAWDKTAHKNGIMVPWEELKRFPCCDVFMRLSEVVLMQYIGLKDKNKIEVYEDDIVSRKGYNTEIGLVVFRNGKYMIKVKAPYYSQKDYVYMDFQNDDYNDGKVNTSFEVSIKILGNIHQHPELLK